MDIKEWVALETNSKENDIEFKKSILVTTIPEVVASFLLIMNAFPTGAELIDGSDWGGGGEDS